MSGRSSAIGFDKRSTVTLALASFAGAIAFGWPLLRVPSENVGHATDAPLVFLLLLPILLVVILAEIADGGIDAKALAMLGVLSAIGAALRPLGAGTAGIETSFFLLIVAGRVFGPGFGFVLGSTAGWARGCRSRCWRHRGSASGRASCPRCAGAGRSRCSRSMPRPPPWRSGS